MIVLWIKCRLKQEHFMLAKKYLLIRFFKELTMNKIGWFSGPSIRNEFLLLFYLHIYIVVSLWYKPPFIFSGIVSDKCRDRNEEPNHYHMKNKQRHSFHGNTLFSRRLNFIKADLWDLKSMRLKAYFQHFLEMFQRLPKQLDSNILQRPQTRLPVFTECVFYLNI